MSRLPCWQHLRKPQQDCFRALQDAHAEGQTDIALQLWCGVGKTLVEFIAIELLGVRRAIVVVPSLSLLRQIKWDYIDRYGLVGWDCVCSEGQYGFIGAQDYVGFGHVLTTYASLPLVDGEFDVAIMDEAHHYKNDCTVAKNIWRFSATLPPSIKPSYEYNFTQAIKDEFAQDFTIECFVRSAKQDRGLSSLLHQMSLSTLNDKLLVFTRFAETDESSVAAWMQQNAEGIQSLGGWVKCLTSKDSSVDRSRIMQEFEQREGWSVLVSCRVLAEGIDTQAADSLLFADPKSSHVAVLQNIGRITRKKPHNRAASIILPIFVDADKYQGTSEEITHRIREAMTRDGDFRPLCNILAMIRDQYPNFRTGK